MIGTLLLDRYEVAGELGRGAMGVVYRARDRVLERDVAVKVLLDRSLDAEARARLLREARAAAGLNHPHIITIFDVGEGPDGPFIVMELASGKNLRHLGPQPIPRILELARQLGEALDHAHRQGTIHRDLKPENILVAEDGERLAVKLADLGVARSRRGAQLTAEGAIVGTALYMAPEQALGADVDGRADLYALGVLLYELVANRPPFTGDDALVVASQHINAPVVPPRTFRPDLPPAFEAVILKLMAKRPADRFASAGAMLEALAAAGSAAAEGPADAALLELLARGRLVGRGSELEQLRTLWGRSREGHGQLVLLSGEPGIGKSRLAREICVQAQLAGATVLEGGCYEFEATTPYLPFVEALRAWVHPQSPDDLRRLLGDSAAVLACLAPEIESRLGALAPPPALAPAEERLRLFDHVARFVQSLAATGAGVLLFLDDLHWADRGTLALLQVMLRRLRAERVLVLAAYRDVELDRAHPLAAALVELNRERLATRLQLGRLSLEDTGMLMATLLGEARVSRDFAAAVHRETEGNPFFLEEVVKSLIEQGQIYREGGRWRRKEIAELSIPQSVKEAVGRRLSRLTPACTSVLHTAAALGKTFRFAELAAVEEAGEDAILDALDEAIAAQLIREAGGASGGDLAFGFTHDKIREVLYAEQNPVRRRRLHQRIGERLETLYPGPAIDAHIQDLAHHFTQSGDLARGLDYARRSAEMARRLFAHDEAVQFLEQARECAEGLGLAADLTAMDEEMGKLHKLRGALPAALECFERALAGSPAPDKAAALKARIGDVYAQTGDARGPAYLEAAVAELDPAAQAVELAIATASLGRYHHYRGHHARAIELLERAQRLAEPTRDPWTLGHIYAYLAGAYQHLALLEQSMEWARRCLALGERENYPMASAIGHEFMSEDLANMGRWAESLEHAARNRQLGEKTGSEDRVAWADFARGWALHGLGRLDEAMATLDGAAALAAANGEQRLGIWLSGVRALVLTDLGDDPAAREAAARGVAGADETGQPLLRAFSRHTLAYNHLHRGEWRQAADLYMEADALMEGTDNRIGHLGRGAAHAAALLGLGRLEDAAERTRKALALAEEAQAPHHLALARRVEGQVFAARAAIDEAERAFDTAITTLETLGSRIELGRALHQRALLAGPRAEGDRERAAELFAACGARRDRDRVLGLAARHSETLVARRPPGGTRDSRGSAGSAAP